MTWTAPPASPAPQDWTLPSPPPLEWRDGIAVSPWLRSVLHPRRGGVATAVSLLATVEEAWAGLRRGVWSEDRAISDKGYASRVWELVTSSQSVTRAVGLRLLDPRPHAGTAEEDRALVEACRARFEYLSGPAHAWLADFLVATHGLVEGCRRILGGLHVELPYVGVGVFGRLRQLLVLADEPTYAQARDALLEVRDRLAAERTGGTRADLFWATSFLLPLGPLAGDVERRAHAAALRYTGEFGNADVHASGLAAGDLDTLERFLAANKQRVRWEFFGTSGGGIYLASVLELAGAAAGPVLAGMKPASPFEDHAHHNGVWCSLLAHIDHDAARDALQREHSAGRAWATRALGPLTDPASFEPARDPSVVTAVPDGVPCDYTPPPAAHPTWLEPAVPVEPVLRWRDEEREAAERFSAHEGDVQWDGVPISRCDPAQVTAWLEHREHWALPTRLPMLALAPLWTHERLMALGFEQHHYWVRFMLPMLLVRHGTSHVAPLLAAFADPRSVEPALQAAQPVGHAALAAPVVQAFAGKKLRRLARSWLLRHPSHAAAGAVALWSATPKDHAVGRVLRYLDAQGHRPLLLAAAGARAGDLTVLLDQDPGVASRLPAYVAGLPPLLTSAAAAASSEQASLLLAQLAVCNADEVHPGVLAARDTWTPASRAAFALELFERWLTAGAPAADGWCMQAVGLIGDDAGARRIASLAKQWPGQGASARAQSALDALRHRGTDAALIELNLLAEKSRFPVFKGVARQHIEAIADLRGLTPDELADRLVPTLGLDDDGDTVDTDAGTFRIVFDHQLLPVLRDAAGRVHAELPKPARGEDKQRHKQAKDRLATLRKEARASASLHVSRLERAMCTGRRVPAAIFLDRFATHPWMSHLARRLVWGVFDGAALVSTVRVAEDGTLATATDEPAILPAGATLGVLHPLEFPTTTTSAAGGDLVDGGGLVDAPVGGLAAWAEVFADYELLQPFEQLGRPFHELAPDERAATTIDRFDGHKVTYAVLRGLERHGWTRWYDAAVQMAKPIDGGAYAILTTDPGWHASDTVDTAPPQTVGALVLARAGDRTFGDLPPVVFSELIHDLRLLASADSL